MTHSVIYQVYLEICLGYLFRVIWSYVWNMSEIFQTYLFRVIWEYVRDMSGIYQTYVFWVIQEYVRDIPDIFLCLWTALQYQCNDRLLWHRHRNWECHHGCLMFSSKRGRRVEHWRCQDWSMPVSCTSMSVTPKNGTPCNLKFPWRRPCRCLALGDGENVKPQVGADSVGAATKRASAHPSTAQALARTCTM